MGTNDGLRMSDVRRCLVGLWHPLLAHVVLGTCMFGAACAAQAQVATDDAASASAPTTVAAPVAPTRAAPMRKPASAAATSLNAPTQWTALTISQRSLLNPLAADWAELSDIQRTKWINATPVLASLSEPELKRLHERMRDWARLTPAERRDARVGFQVAKQVGAEERQARWDAYQALPPEKRQELIDKANARRQAQMLIAPQAPKALSSTAKSNIVPPAPKLVTPTPVTGTVILAKPGASTVLITRSAIQPSHHAVGEAKVVADPTLVDAKTLLPKSLKAPNPGLAGPAQPQS